MAYYYSFSLYSQRYTLWFYPLLADRPALTLNPNYAHSFITVKRKFTDGASGRASKRPRIAGSNPQQWLSNLHSALWGQPIRDQIIRRSTLTFAQFLKLDDDLNNKNALRKSDNYQATSVWREKLKVLGETVTTAEAIREAPDVDNPLCETVTTAETTDNDKEADQDEEDDDPRCEYKQYFPVIVDYVDLSLLGPPDSNPPRCPHTIYIRKEYAIFDRLLKHESEWSIGASAVVSGQPGIGEISFIHLILP
jgi:hypothetical protein